MAYRLTMEYGNGSTDKHSIRLFLSDFSPILSNRAAADYVTTTPGAIASWGDFTKQFWTQFANYLDPAYAFQNAYVQHLKPGTTDQFDPPEPLPIGAGYVGTDPTPVAPSARLAGGYYSWSGRAGNGRLLRFYVLGINQAHAHPSRYANPTATAAVYQILINAEVVTRPLPGVDASDGLQNLSFYYPYFKVGYNDRASKHNIY